MVDPLNPYAAVLPFAAFLVACVGVAARRWWALVPAVALGSYAAQAHLTTAGMVAIAAIGTVAGGLLNRSSGANGWRRPLATSAVLLVVCWSAPLVDVATRGGGNVAALTATGGARTAAGGSLRASFDKTTNAVAPIPVWLRSGADVPSLLTRPSPVEVAACATVILAAVGLGIAAWRRRREEPNDAAIVGGAAIASTLLAGGTLLFARFPTAFFNVFALGNYLWLWPASALAWGVAVGGAAAPLGRRVPALRAPLAALPVLALAGFAASSIADPSSAPIDRSNPAVVRELSAQLVSHLDRDATYRFDLSVEFAEQAVDTGVVHELLRRGFDIRVTPFFEPSYAWRADPATTVDGVLEVVVARDTPTGDGERLASFTPSTPARARLARAERAVVARFERNGGLDEALFPAFGKPVPASVQDFVEGDFLTMAATGFLGPTADWPETRELAAARRQPVLRAAVFLRPPAE
mgnify:CR=1 FL=1